MLELKHHQQPMTVDEQIVNLKEKNLIVDDEDYARSILNEVSYFRLFKAYSLGLKAKNGDYYHNVHFEDIVDLYLFNSAFRQRLFIEIERVEVSLRSRISDYFCGKYGAFGYEDVCNFAISPEIFDVFINVIQLEISRNSRTPFVRNFQENYIGGKIPLYALVELIGFGTLSKFYKNMKNEDKKAVAQMYKVGYTYFESWIESIAYVRNICAHYGRLYNNRLVKAPKLYKQYANIGNQKVFATLLTLKHILPCDARWSDFVSTLELLITNYPSVKLSFIGFPQDWSGYLIEKTYYQHS